MESNGTNGAVVEGSIVRVEPQAVAAPLAISEYHSRAAQAAGFVKAIVLGSAVQISGRKYVPVTSYQAIANAMGCVASARDVRRVEGGFVAHGELKRLSDGMVLAEGEGFVGDDEPMWKSRPEYAKRSMAQTRAIGRACRAGLAFVVPMIDMGLSETPAEEMEGIGQGSETPPPPTGAAGVRAQLKGPPLSPPKHGEPPPGTSLTRAGHDRERQFRFGNAKGKPLRLLEEGDLKFYERALNNDLTNPEKQQYVNSNRAALADVVAELKHRGVS